MNRKRILLFFITMTNKDIHDELAALGISKEIHSLVDDLDLDFGVPPLAFRLLHKRRKVSVYVPIRTNSWNLVVELQKRNRNYVRFAYSDNKEKTGRLF